MQRFAEILRREGPATVAREAVWRVTKRWHEARFRAIIELNRCPVHFRPVGHYRPQLAGCGESYRASLVRYANAVCAGEFPFFASGPVRLGFPPSWNVDFVSGKSWPQEPSEKIAVVRNDGSDVKVPWELSRLQFLPVLGKAWLLTRREQYRGSAREFLTDWIAKNPVSVGVNWTLAMEAALRSFSMCLLLELLWPLREEEQAWLEDVTRSLWQHLLYIEAHNEFSHFGRSNHYLSNVVGLLGLACYLEGPGMTARRQKYARQVQQEILHQTYEDGASYEASLGYHVLDTQMFTSALLLMRATGTEIGAAFSERLRRMYRLLAALADLQGSLPHVGDCDDGRMELLSDDLEQPFRPASERHSLHVSGLLAIGAGLFDLPNPSRRDDAAWYGLRSGEGGNQEREWGIENPMVFLRSGFARARRGDADLLFLAIPNGIFGKGSHTHNDKLSFILRLGEHELFCDCGTGCYTRDTEIRNRFRSTEAHNTVRVDGQEQNRILLRPSGLFRLGNEARVSPIETCREEAGVGFRAAHFGYQDRGVVHTRSVIVDTENSLRIEDEFAGSREHELEQFFHFDSRWHAQLTTGSDHRVRCELDGPRRIIMSWDAPFEIDVRAEPWRVSRAYGAESDSTRVLARARATIPLRLVTRISWGY